MLCSTITFRIDRLPQEPIVSQATGSKKILIVDDEADMVTFMATLLAANGYTPIVARDPVEGMAKARRLNPDCIILNAMMTGDGGITLYVNLRCDQQLRTVPVIMLSAIGRKIFLFYPEAQASADGRDLREPECYLETPPDAEELLRQVQKLSAPATA
jgi:CheY-like chemotaxis protein